MPSGWGRPAKHRGPDGGAALEHGDQDIACTPCRGAVWRKLWGVPFQCKDEAADLRQLVGHLARDVGEVADTCLLGCGHGFGEKRYAPIRVTQKMNLLSRYHPS